MSDKHIGMPGPLGFSETRLPADPAAASVAASTELGALEEVAGRHPASSLTWARLAEARLARGEAVLAYACARTGYHRGLDALRRAGWRGQGPIPWEHEPNRGFLRALAALARAADAIGEDDESARCRQFLRDSSQTAALALGV